MSEVSEVKAVQGVQKELLFFKNDRVLQNRLHKSLRLTQKCCFFA